MTASLVAALSAATEVVVLQPWLVGGLGRSIEEVVEQGVEEEGVAPVRIVEEAGEGIEEVMAGSDKELAGRL
jgi:hypothetical protein